MAYVYDPRVTRCVVTIAAETANDRSMSETHIFLVETHGQEVVSQLTDTILSALHLAESAARATPTVLVAPEAE